MDDLTNKVALVTGAGAGIGRAIALRLAMSGAEVGLFDLNAAGANATEELITALGRRAVVAQGNVASRADVIRGVEAVARELGPIDILVNNAGILRIAAFLDVTEEDWRRIFAISLDGVFHFSQAVLPAMVPRKSGAIVNVSSWTGKKGVPNHAAYGATKAAIINLTQSLAGEFGSSGIRINAVCPGIIVETEMRAEAEEMNRAQGLPDVASRVQAIPLRRAGTPSEIAELVAFLASDRAAYMTGQAINVTGGHWMN
jgi:NAD(P)-dependent dehydrogenase (short-subunit alcohol dehydrogenase family)